MTALIQGDGLVIVARLIVLAAACWALRSLYVHYQARAAARDAARRDGITPPRAVLDRPVRSRP